MISMAKLRLKTLKINNNSTKTIEECYSEYMDYCKSIGLRQATLVSKQRFYKYDLLKNVSADDGINVITQKKVEEWINSMIDYGYKGNTYQTFVIKLKAFLTYCFTREYLKEYEVKIPNVVLEKKEIYTEDELEKLLKKPDLDTCLVGDYRSFATVSFLIGAGCRSETLLNVKVKDINFEEEMILFAHMKAKRQANIPLSKSLKLILKDYIETMKLKDDDILFPKLDGTKMSYDTLHQNLVNYLSYMAEKERQKIKIRQREGIEALKERNDGKGIGRPSAEYPVNF